MAAQQKLDNFLFAAGQAVGAELVEGGADLEVQVLRRTRLFRQAQAPGFADHLFDHRLGAVHQLQFIATERRAGRCTHQRQHRHGAATEIDEKRHFLGQTGLLVIREVVLAQVKVVRRKLAQATQTGCLFAGASEVKGVQQIGAALVVVDVNLALVGCEGVEQRQGPVIALVDEQHEMVDRADLL